MIQAMKLIFLTLAILIIQKRKKRKIKSIKARTKTKNHVKRIKNIRKRRKNIKKTKKTRKKKSKKKKKDKKSKSKKKRNNFFGDGNNYVSPNSYKQGQYGFITEKDKFSKVPEFTAWLIEIHNVSRDELSAKEEKKWWIKFCDDWNTSTMADEKYYDLDKWDKEQSKIKKNNVPDDSHIYGLVNDEELLRQQRQQQRFEERTRKEQARVAAYKANLKEMQGKRSKEFEKLREKHAPKEHTFESLAAQRRKDKIEKSVARMGRYGAGVAYD